MTDEVSTTSRRQGLKSSLAFAAATAGIMAAARWAASGHPPGSRSAAVSFVAALATWAVLILRELASAHAAAGLVQRSHAVVRCAAGALVLGAVAVGPAVMFDRHHRAAATAAWLVVFCAYGLLSAMRTRQVSRGIAGGVRMVETVADQWLPKGLFAIVWREGYIVLLGLVGWFMKPVVPAGATTFSNSRVARPMIAAVLALSLVELAVIHLFAGLVSQTLGRILLVGGLLVVVYILGILRSFSLYPTFVARDRVGIRMTVFFNQEFARAEIESVEPCGPSDHAAEGVVNAAILVPPNLLMRLRGTVPSKRPGRPWTEVGAVAFYVDEPSALIEACAGRGVGMIAADRPGGALEPALGGAAGIRGGALS